MWKSEGAHMPKGGRREGAGRSRGSRGKRTQASIAQAETLGPTPLEVLLESMHAARAEGERAEAVECAKAAAPYIHPKLAQTSPSAPVHEEMDYSVCRQIYGTRSRAGGLRGPQVPRCDEGGRCR